MGNLGKASWHGAHLKNVLPEEGNRLGCLPFGLGLTLCKSGATSVAPAFITALPFLELPLAAAPQAVQVLTIRHPFAGGLQQ